MSLEYRLDRFATLHFKTKFGKYGLSESERKEYDEFKEKLK